MRVDASISGWGALVGHRAVLTERSRRCAAATNGEQPLLARLWHDFRSVVFVHKKKNSLLTPPGFLQFSKQIRRRRDFLPLLPNGRGGAPSQVAAVFIFGTFQLRDRGVALVEILLFRDTNGVRFRSRACSADFCSSYRYPGIFYHS